LKFLVAVSNPYNRFYIHTSTHPSIHLPTHLRAYFCTILCELNAVFALNFCSSKFSQTYKTNFCNYYILIIFRPQIFVHEFIKLYFKNLIKLIQLKKHIKTHKT
jgi:hypothetical protein